MSSRIALDVLLSHACPSIRYRIREEILGDSRENLDASGLKDQILRDPVVSEVLSWRRPDGWLGDTFHSGRGPETGVRVLVEKGLRTHPCVSDAIHALEAKGDDFDEGCLSHVGKVLDAYHLGGSKTIKASVLATASVQDESLVMERVEEALDAFRFVVNVDSVADVSRKHRRWLVFREGVRWPSLYHLRLLAWTTRWRSQENLDMLVASISRLVALSPIPQMHLLNKSQIMAPASVFMLDFAPDLGQMKPQGWMGWFHRMEMLSRLGVVSSVTGLARQVERLNDEFFDGDGFFAPRINHYCFHRWNAYSGLALESDWKHPGSRAYDLTFRCVVINHYSGHAS